MNQTDTLGVVDKMRAYVVLAEKEIEKRKIQCKLLEDELESSQRLMQSLQNKLREAEAAVIQQQKVKRVSQFKMQKIESGGRIQVPMATGQSPFGEGMNRRPCQVEGCCRLERLYLPDGGYEEIQTDCHSVGLPQNVFRQETTGTHGFYTVLLPTCEPCPSPIRSENNGADIVADTALTMCDIWRSWTDMVQTYKKRERRTAMRRRTKLKRAVHEAFGSNTIPEESTV